jgi:hypothetical protein
VPTVTVHRPGQPAEPREVSTPVRAGGSNADDLLLPGCPPGALRLVPCAAGVVAEAVAAGVRAAGRPLPPGARRLLRAGERVEVQGVAIALDGDDERTRASAGALLREAAAGAGSLAGAHLVVLSGPAAGARHPLGEDQTVGRGRAATIAIPDPQASRVHARIRMGPQGATVEDLRSKNGVRVNGVRIERRPFPLEPADEVTVGETALAVARLLGAGAAPAARTRRRLEASALAAALLALSAAALALAAG